MLILYNLLKIIKTVQYVQNIIRCNINFKKKYYIDCFLQKEFCKNIIICSINSLFSPYLGL